MLPPVTVLRLLDSAAPTWPARRSPGQARLDWPAPLDMYVRDDALHLTADLPGVALEDVQLHAEAGLLHLRAERRSDPDPTDEVVVAERPYGTFSRTVQVGPSFDPAAARAELRDGVLTVTVPRHAAAARRQIRIGTTGSADSADSAASDDGSTTAG